jgi:DNA-binding transcriptional ArsR family regulator
MVCQAFSDPTRLRLMVALASGPKPAARLRSDLDLDATMVSRHMKVLHGAGLVVSVRRGREAVYELDDVDVATAGGSVEFIVRCEKGAVRVVWPG